eukprot:92133-Chlamydomonas_euryale.AAC.1
MHAFHTSTRLACVPPRTCSVHEYPASSSAPAMRSESAMFICREKGSFKCWEKDMRAIPVYHIQAQMTSCHSLLQLRGSGGE